MTNTQTEITNSGRSVGISGPGGESAQSITYEPVTNWGRLPLGMTFYGDATSVAVDSADRVYIFNRGPVPVIVFDRDGNYLDGWGEGGFDSAHGLAIDEDDALYLVDCGGHFLQKRSRDGARGFTLGVRGKPSEPHSGKPFNMPTDVAIHPRTGDLFITDGYLNSHVHRFDATGKHLQSWGGPGSDAGQFSLPHGVALLGDDRLAVCDRENFRVQFFTTSGEFLEQWHAHRPAGIRYVTSTGYLYIAELGPTLTQDGVPNLGNCVAVYDSEGNRLAKLSGASLRGGGHAELIAPHSLAIDSRGDVYLAEVSASWSRDSLGRALPPGELLSLRKWCLVDHQRDEVTAG